jgi:hypothetical protein
VLRHRARADLDQRVDRDGTSGRRRPDWSQRGLVSGRQETRLSLRAGMGRRWLPLKGVKTPFRHLGVDSEVLAALRRDARFGTVWLCLSVRSADSGSPDR